MSQVLVEVLSFLNFMFQFGECEFEAKQSILLFALHTDLFSLARTKNINTCLWLPGPSVLLRARITPDFFPKVETERFKRGGVIGWWP